MSTLYIRGYHIDEGTIVDVIIEDYHHNTHNNKCFVYYVGNYKKVCDWVTKDNIMIKY